MKIYAATFSRIFLNHIEYRITLHKYRSVPIGITMLTEFFKDLFAQWSDNFFGFTAPIALSAIALARAVKLLATL